MAHRPRVTNQRSLRILRRLLASPDLGYREIGIELGMSASTVNRYVDRMKETGTIVGQSWLLNEERLYDGTIAFARIKLQDQKRLGTDDFLKRMKACKQVLEIYSVPDSADYLVKVLSDSNGAYSAFVEDVLRKCLAFDHVDSILVLKPLLRRQPEAWRAFPFAEVATPDPEPDPAVQTPPQPDPPPPSPRPRRRRP